MHRANLDDCSRSNRLHRIALLVWLVMTCMAADGMNQPHKVYS